MNTENSFCTLINCMDGRTQEPAMTWLKERTGVEYVDSITEAGPDGILTNHEHPLLQNILTRIRISRDKHGSKVLALVAHHDCAGNPGERAMHLQHLTKAANTLKRLNLGMQFFALWIDENWEVHLVQEEVL